MTEPVSEPETVGTWAKRYYYANRGAVDRVLRPRGIGSTQWAVLYQLATSGPTSQRDLGRALHIERASLSGIIATLVRKGLVDQAPSATDQRQRLVTLTTDGRALWSTLPDPFAEVRSIALVGIDPDDLATAIRVLRTATEQVEAHTFGDS
ncbi:MULTISPECIES: MarR family winged helix-turn-helix transcriptional regulator [unclassified Leifsonia]|uniref:MarR family winged helix-turn-helix transcriptional regulator n=1 Tax=unclassified Leifsonia TaxID=2663824 RepID=UPI000378E935|nr:MULTISPECIES: MarR family transcriptional regulator [unclassified Leifsonia]TDQ02307.1 DNA-binding MarR family transcriptional regulator [Leifsonia sp. 115AMFTsu3.1]